MKLRPPRQILAALERVRELHPYALSGAIAPTKRVETEVGDLWADLLKGPPGEIESRIAALTALQVRLVLYGGRSRLEQPMCRAILERLFARWNPLGHDHLAWEAYLLENRGEGFRAAAARRAADMQSVAAMAVAKSELPFDECVRNYRESARPFEEWIGAYEGLIDEQGLLGRELRKRLLADVVTAPLHENELTIRRWLKECLIDSQRADWYVAFLRRTATLGWNPRSPLMMAIVDRYGEPTQREPFWARLDEAVRAAVRRWILDRKLTAFLEGERLDFWRDYLPRMTEIYTLGKEAILVVFAHALAVQFREMGRATYLFPRNLLTRFRRYEGMHSYQTAALYREVLDQNAAGKALGRYEHRGYGWQGPAGWEVDRVLTEAGDA